jgi:hypothetical protein
MLNENHSTGPTTPEGKQRSSQNAIKHGIFARSIVLPGESQEEYDKLLYRYNKDHRPKGVTEEDLVRVLAQTEWRRRRIPGLEAEAMDKSIETGDTERKFINTYTLYEQRLNRNFQSTLKLLGELQAKRKRETALEFGMACLLYSHFKAKNIPWNPADDGFVFSPELLARKIILIENLQDASNRHLGTITEEELVMFIAKEAA